MKLQLALDLVDLKESLVLVEKVHEFIDIVEIGTPFVLRYGMAPVREMKKAFPDLTLLADLKIMDAGEHEARIGFEAGADIVTVLGAAEAMTIERTIRTAAEYGRKVMADMIAVQNTAARGKLIDDLGADYICVHTAFDIQGEGIDPAEELTALTGILKKAKPAVAGGITVRTIETVVSLKPEIIAVGSGITGQKNPEEAARLIKAAMK